MNEIIKTQVVSNPVGVLILSAFRTQLGTQMYSVNVIGTDGRPVYKRHQLFMHEQSAHELYDEIANRGEVK